jgi:transposase InsO family protein
MPLKVMDLVEQRLAVLQEPAWSGRSVREVCQRHGISPDTFYAWKRAYDAEGLAGLIPASRRPRTSPGQVTDPVTDQILRLRKEHGWGPRKIRDALAREFTNTHTDADTDTDIGADIGAGGARPVPAISTIQQVLARHGVGPLRPRRAARREEGTRFTRAASNELWQIDGTQRHLADGTPYWAVDLIDDHSRYCPHLMVGPALTGQLAWTTLRAAVATCGLPAQLLSDNGLCFTGRLHAMIVSFERQVIQAGIRFAHSRPYHPQTCGKVERLHATVDHYLLHHHQPPRTLTEAQTQHDAFREHYNTVRPHQALNGATPADRYRPGTGQLLPVIDLEPADHNPPGSLHRRVGANGLFTYAGRQFPLGTRWSATTIGLQRDGARLHVFYGQSLIETFLVGTELPTPTR